MTDKNYIKKIKLMFSGTIGTIAFIMILGMFMLKNNIIFTSEYAEMSFNYLKYKTEMLDNSGVLQAASVGSLLTKTIKTENLNLGNSAISIPVLVYHRIIDSTETINVTPNNFKEQMFFLKENGYTTINLEQLLKFMEGKILLPKKSILITFDDGTKDSFYPTDPVFRAVGFNAVNFVITEHSFEEKDNGYYLTKREIELMKDNGRWNIESHTKNGHKEILIDIEGNTGAYLTNRAWIAAANRIETVEEYKKRITSDLLESKIDIEENLCTTVLGFAFPFGDFGYNAKNISAEDSTNILGEIIGDTYKLSFYQPFTGESTRNLPEPNQENYYIARIRVENSWTKEDVLRAIELSE